MRISSFSPVTGLLTKLEEAALQLEDPRPHPPEAALEQVGHALMNELVDLLSETALEDFQGVICEALIGAFHSAALRIEREADRARDQVSELTRHFDGSEVADTELQEATAKAWAADVAVMSVEVIRDSAAATYTTATGEVWSPWKGSVRGSRTTAAQIEAREAIRAMKARKQGAADPGASVVAFRAAPQADTEIDAMRIYDALNWAQAQWPDMALATTGARGAEKIAIKWAERKKVKVVLATPDFERYGRRAAGFRANDELLELEPVCVLTLPNTLNEKRGAGLKAFGAALNLGQKAVEMGMRHVAIKPRG